MIFKLNMQGANISQIGILEAFPLISKPLVENSVFKTILYQKIGNDKRPNLFKWPSKLTKILY